MKLNRLFLPFLSISFLAVCVLALPPAERKLEEIPFDGQLAHQYLTELCAIGPRPTGSEGMKRQQEFLVTHFS